MAPGERLANLCPEGYPTAGASASTSGFGPLGGGFAPPNVPSAANLARRVRLPQGRTG